MAVVEGDMKVIADDATAESGGDLMTLKFYSILIIFAIAMFGGLSPIRLKSSRFRDRGLSVGNALAGGVFLSAGLIHMLGEAVESLNGQLTEPWSDYPIGYICALGGMFAVIFVEKIMTAPVQRRRGAPAANAAAPATVEDGHGHSHHQSFLDIMDANGTGKPDATEEGSGGVPSAFLPYLLAILLAFHSLVEGVALGVETTHEKTTMILLAIVAHKWFSAFALGVALSKVGTIQFREHLKVIAFFSATTPMGIAMGMLLSSALADAMHGIIADCITCVAAGTFIYVGLVEVLVPEFENPADPIMKFIAMVTGAVVMSLLAALL